MLERPVLASISAAFMIPLATAISSAVAESPEKITIEQVREELKSVAPGGLVIVQYTQSQDGLVALFTGHEPISLPRGLLESSPLPVKVSTGHPFTLDEAASELDALGPEIREHFPDHAGFTYDLDKDTVVIDIVQGERSSAANQASLNSLQSRTSHPITLNRVETIPTQGNRGGVDAVQSTGGSCTTGFSIITRNGDRRFTTAGHCGNNIRYRSSASGTTYRFYLQGTTLRTIR